MKRILASLAALAFCAPLLARAAEGWVVADISLQAGPDTDYPSIAELDAGTPVSIQGCIDGWTWCDVIVGDDRGWVPGTFLEEEVGGRPVVIIDSGPRIGIPIVSFSIGAYWDRHYHNRPFYAERQRFESHEIRGHAPPRPSAIVATAPRQGARPRPASGTAMQGSASVRGSATTQTGTSTQNRTTVQSSTNTRERMNTEQRNARTQNPPAATSPRTDTQTATAQRGRDEHRTDTTRSGQAQTERQSAQARTERPAAKPRDNAPQMVPHERPTGTAPQDEQRQTQVARNATPRNQHDQDKRQGPKPKDELKKSDNKKKDDNGNDGGGKR